MNNFLLFLVDYYDYALNSAPKKTSLWSRITGNPGQFFLLVCIVVFAGILAYYAYDFFRNGGFNKRNIKVIERVSLGASYGKLCLVKAGEKYLLVGTTREHISLLSEVLPNTANTDKTVAGNLKK